MAKDAVKRSEILGALVTVADTQDRIVRSHRVSNF